MQRPHRGHVVFISGRLFAFEGRTGAWVTKVAGDSSSLILKEIQRSDKSHIGTHVLTANAFSVKHGMWHQLICTGFIIVRMRYNFLFPYIPLVSYPAASLSIWLFFSEEADKARCWLALLSGKCRVAVTYRTS